MKVVYNAGHSKDAFATRVRMLRQHPEVWRQIPNGITVDSCQREPSHRQLWCEVVEFLRSCGVISQATQAIDVNVPKIIAAVRGLET